MKINSPLCITPSLEPGIEIDGAWLSISYASRPGREGRTRYRWRWIVDGHEESGDDLQSGCGGGDLNEGLGAFIEFLSAFGDAHRPGCEPGENSELFPGTISEWAYRNADALSMVAEEIENNKPIEE